MRPGAQQAPCDFPLASYYATTVEISAWGAAERGVSRQLPQTPTEQTTRPTSPCTYIYIWLRYSSRRQQRLQAGAGGPFYGAECCCKGWVVSRRTANRLRHALNGNG